MRYVNRTWPFIPEFLLELKEPVFDLFLYVEWQLPFSAKKLAIALGLVLNVINV